MDSFKVVLKFSLWQYFHMVLFIEYLILTFESVDEILWC